MQLAPRDDPVCGQRVVRLERRSPVHHRSVHLPRGLLGVCANSTQRLPALSAIPLPRLRAALHRERERLSVRLWRPQLHRLLVQRRPLGMPFLLT